MNVYFYDQQHLNNGVYGGKKNVYQNLDLYTNVKLLFHYTGS